MRVLAHWDSLRDRGAADAYVRRTIVRQHISWHRQPWRRDGGRHGTPPGARAVPTTSGTAIDAAGVWSLVQALPPQQRATVALRYYEELTVAETAAVLGCSTGTVKSNTSRGLAALRRAVAGTALAG